MKHGNPCVQLCWPYLARQSRSTRQEMNPALKELAAAANKEGTSR